LKQIDLDTWPRAAQFRHFRTYEKPHYAITSRLDVTHLMGRKDALSPYRACLYAIGAGLHAVPELLMRFRGDSVVQHASVALSMTVPATNGSFNYAYVPFNPDFSVFDQMARSAIDAAASASELGANTGETDAVAYLSCLPWLDYTSMNNALSNTDDCIPRVSWGKFASEGDRWRMAMTLEVHHALVDGAQVGAYFENVQRRLDTI